MDEERWSQSEVRLYAHYVRPALALNSSLKVVQPRSSAPEYPIKCLKPWGRGDRLSNFFLFFFKNSKE